MPENIAFQVLECELATYGAGSSAKSPERAISSASPEPWFEEDKSLRLGTFAVSDTDRGVPVRAVL